MYSVSKKGVRKGSISHTVMASLVRVCGGDVAVAEADIFKAPNSNVSLLKIEAAAELKFVTCY
jgi:hypothetical protein